jgi:hypothetical protein
VLILLLLLSSIPVVAGLQPVVDPDIWWHMQTGQWIVEHRTVPTTDPFSTFGQGRPWAAYSWLFDLAVYGLYQVGGLRGILVGQFLLFFAILLALQHLVMLVEPRPLRSAALTALAYLALSGVLGPRSYLVSILFFILVVSAVVSTYRTGRGTSLLLLPPLFMLCANVHVQFVYGFVILGVATLDAFITRWWKGSEDPRLPLGALLVVDGACLLATLLTPYHVRLYLVLYDVAAQTGVYWFNDEMVAPRFRGPSDWVLLGLTLAAAFVLPRVRHRRFLGTIFAIGVFVSFRSGRDVWFVIVCATLIVAMANTEVDMAAVAFTLSHRTRSWAIVAAVLMFAVLVSVKSPAGLDARVRREFPDGAAHAVETGGYPGPLYNHFNWGGYLIWRLPHLKVSMDGRSHVHGDERIIQSLRTWAGLGDWRSDPELGAARVVIASTNMALASLLTRDARFREVYHDDIARVFVAQPHPATSARHP